VLSVPKATIKAIAGMASRAILRNMINPFVRWQLVIGFPGSAFSEVRLFLLSPHSAQRKNNRVDTDIPEKCCRYELVWV
jgi:hypothetical protein